MASYEFYIYAYLNKEDEEELKEVDELTVWEDGNISDEKANKLLDEVIEKLVNGIVNYGYTNCADYHRLTIKDGNIVKSESRF